ncbi:phenoloxidase-activating factor 2 [Eupeodes corollae]|uniref:phenoloxidase-activating factor 2 n=1 Tax=Eupeodes corollae TaxID=290404 RepID=UPI002490CE37|nr:phenoloxidase-activating factor 2 [Eupeodes corollae]XP_055904303.1 phenoloxidase-activating factor 2 [Eupeodes corollae]
MLMWFYVLTTTTVLCCSSVSAQDLPPNIAGVIADIFNSNATTTQRPVATRRPGFGDIVTSEPITATSQPQILKTDDGVKCTCVPYYLCRPGDNTLRDDGEVDGFGKIDIRFDPYSCQHYLDICCIDNRTVSEPIKTTPVVNRPNQPTGCGIRNANVDFEITGNNDNEANFGELPWTVALLSTDNEEYFCAGSLIHPQVVLTAAHCVRKYGPNQFKARAGEWDSQTTRERLPFQELNAQQIIMHPGFNPQNVANDFALVVMSQPFVLADHINVVCLPAPNVVPAAGETCLSSGWGRDKFGSAGKYSVIMKRVPLPVVEFGQCQSVFRASRLGKYFVLDPSFMCAGGQQGVDTCTGDGGGPLVCSADASQNRYYQSGIVAWGLGCNDPIPAAYASVALARTWIDEEMNKLGYGVSSYSY